MKRLIALLGVFALLGTLFVLATSSPASAATSGIDIKNNGAPGDNPILATGVTGCESVSVEVAVGDTETIVLDIGCGDATVYYSDALAQCTINGNATSSHNVTGANNWNPDSRTRSVNMGNCVGIPGTVTVEKRADFIVDVGAVLLSEYTMAIVAPEIAAGGTQSAAEAAACQAAPLVWTQAGGPPGDTSYELPSAVVSPDDGQIHTCVWSGAEATAPAGQNCTNGAGGTFINNASVAPALCVIAGWAFTPGLPAGAPNNRTITFYNTVDPVPMTVTKTFVGRDYYTTVDRGDFHIYTPGFCSGLPLDPFGGLLGNFGVYRTINASQQSQIVWLTPFIITASPLGPCTYRVQENNMPDGCTAVDPDGEDADGPYWDQTWAPGTLALNYNIVNDCSPPVDPPPPAKKPGSGAGAKKPSGGGSAAPKFTG